MYVGVLHHNVLLPSCTKYNFFSKTSPNTLPLHKRVNFSKYSTLKPLSMMSIQVLWFRLNFFVSSGF